jgi:hypothetical protein
MCAGLCMPTTGCRSNGACMHGWIARSCRSPSIRFRLDWCGSSVRVRVRAFKARPLSLTSHLFSRHRPLGTGRRVSVAYVQRSALVSPVPFCSCYVSLSRAEGESSPGFWREQEERVLSRDLDSRDRRLQLVWDKPDDEISGRTGPVVRRTFTDQRPASRR